MSLALTAWTESNNLPMSHIKKTEQKLDERHQEGLSPRDTFSWWDHSSHGNHLQQHGFIQEVAPSRARALKETTLYEGSRKRFFEGLKQAEIGAHSFCVSWSLLARLQGNLRIIHAVFHKIKWVGTQFGSGTHFPTSSHGRVIKRENKYSDHGRFNVCSSIPRF